jgi:hypothetical protein
MNYFNVIVDFSKVANQWRSQGEGHCAIAQGFF